jgi:hypothetical protein
VARQRRYSPIEALGSDMEQVDLSCILVFGQYVALVEFSGFKSDTS